MVKMTQLGHQRKRMSNKPKVLLFGLTMCAGVSQLSEVDFHTLGLVVMKNVGQKKIYKVRPLELFFSDLNSNFSGEKKKKYM